VSQAVLTEWEQDWANRPRLRGWLHVGALPAALAATTVLTFRRPTHRAPVAAYGAGLTAMLATSAGYHRLTRTETQFRWSQPADHMMIFAAIAGSVTPVASAVLPRRYARGAIAGVWAAAALGAFGRLVDLRRGTHISSFSYLALGWAGALLFPGVVRRSGLLNGALLAAGGVSYTVGAVAFAANRPNPHPEWFGYHEVFHAATLVGAACHLVAIANITRESPGGAGDDTDPDAIDDAVLAPVVPTPGPRPPVSPIPAPA